MRRADRAQDRDFCLSVIDRCTHGVAALTTGEDIPYCLPLSFVRVGNSLYFHCAREGRKVELLKRCPRICITFVAQDDPNFEAPNNYTTYFQSAIVTGTVVLVGQPGRILPTVFPSPLSVWVTASIFIVPVRGVRWSC